VIHRRYRLARPPSPHPAPLAAGVAVQAWRSARQLGCSPARWRAVSMRPRAPRAAASGAHWPWVVT